MRKFLSFISLILVMPCFTRSQTLNIIPHPAKVEVKEGNFTVTPSTKIILSASGVDKSVRFLNNYLKEYYGFELKVSKNKSGFFSKIGPRSSILAQPKRAIRSAWNLSSEMVRSFAENASPFGRINISTLLYKRVRAWINL